MRTATLEALGVAVAARVPVLLWGSPGTGKSSAVRALAEAAGMGCETVIASIREPSDFAGLPIVSGGEVLLAPPAWARRLHDAGSGVLFLDEISTAPPAVQSALLRVVLERTVGDLALPPEVTVIAAANPPDESADGWDLSAPLANRFCHLEWQTDAAQVAHGLAAGWPAPAVPTLPGDWGDRRAAGRGLIAGFLRVRPSLACAVPRNAVRAGRGWPSPRTWEMAATLWSAAIAAGASESARHDLVAGCVGMAASIELLEYSEGLDLPDPENLLADPTAYQPPARADRAHAILAALVAAVARDPTPARWLAAWKVLERAAERGADVAALAARDLVSLRPEGAPAPPEARRFLPVLRGAGFRA